MTNQLFPQLNAAVITLLSISTLIAYPVIADTSDSEYTFLVTQDWRSCDHIGKKYQEVYAFETPSFYVNICRKGKSYFYLGEAKSTNVGSIFIPAQLLKEGKMYRADNGNVSYYVAINETEPEATPENKGTLTIERNGNQVLTENSVTQHCLFVESPASLNVRNKPNEQASQIGTIPARSQVTLANLDPQGNPQIKQGLNGSLWVEISNPYQGFILYGNEEKSSLDTCQ
ncbi:hypothetical protein Sta7437_1428 [Stanieria cyanosphaera PCC 7437]|uniref:Uncharacterized protein n=1 Tax=Stanieria cyanosphaera (strain ATCC 29371 / PCC 7437) TaxID=111780 RepID=K9XQV3_STAC7|nr:SH3 domain-containing protein [Stanieria cyanosphaera]AFZ34995.1 hypothetical protein Sta7437_1428 [Stanieria cyanosphaera PCC 7437]